MIRRAIVSAIALSIIIKLLPIIAIGALIAMIVAAAVWGFLLLARKWRDARPRGQAPHVVVRRVDDPLDALTPSDVAWLSAHGWTPTHR
jgi:hypothetical protein